MKISVVTVTYNAGRCVTKTLQSLRQQQHADLELIVIDGGSTDDTLARIADFSDLQPVVFSGPDAGIYDAMNKGVDVATGDAVYFLNADDRLALPTALADLADVLGHSPATGVAYGDVVVVGETGDNFRSYSRFSSRRLGYEPLCHQATLVRRSLFTQIGGFDLQYRISADLDWLIRCDAAGVGFRHVPRLVCFYAAGGESDRLLGLRRQENARILQAHRSGLDRFRLRLAAAVRRRLRQACQRWAG